jgi:hypothetical protein
MRGVIWLVGAITAAVFLYGMRFRRRLIYGIVELLFGLIAISLSSFSQGPVFAAPDEQPPFAPLASWVAFAAGVYIIVRGLDNIRLGLPERWRPRWDKIFGSSTRKESPMNDKPSDTDGQEIGRYACAIGSAILAFNTIEAELADLLMELGHGQEVEGWWFAAKVEALKKKAAAEEHEANARESYGHILAEIERLGSQRNNFAHALLWFDPFEGTHQRRFVRLEGKKDARRLRIEHDARSPEEIATVVGEMNDLALSIGALASQIRNRAY